MRRQRVLTLFDLLATSDFSQGKHVTLVRRLVGRLPSRHSILLRADLFNLVQEQAQIKKVSLRLNCRHADGEIRHADGKIQNKIKHIWIDEVARVRRDSRNILIFYDTWLYTVIDAAAFAA